MKWERLRRRRKRLSRGVRRSAGEALEKRDHHRRRKALKKAKVISMNIGFGYGRYAAAPTLVLVGLIVLTGLPTAAQPASGKPPAAAGTHQVKPRADGVRRVADVCVWDGFDWDQLSNAERRAWETLGWSRALWQTNNSTRVSSSSKDWSELSNGETNAAGSLGFSPHNWNVVCPRR